jgi:hypothetical protein
MEKYESKGVVHHDIVKDGFYVIAECAVESDAFEIMVLLNFFESIKQLKKKEHELLKELVVSVK